MQKRVAVEKQRREIEEKYIHLKCQNKEMDEEEIITWTYLVLFLLFSKIQGSEALVTKEGQYGDGFYTCSLEAFRVLWLGGNVDISSVSVLLVYLPQFPSLLTSQDSIIKHASQMATAPVCTPEINRRRHSGFFLRKPQTPWHTSFEFKVHPAPWPCALWVVFAHCIVSSVSLINKSILIPEQPSQLPPVNNTFVSCC